MGESAGGRPPAESKLKDRIGKFTAVPNSFIEASKTMSAAAFRLFVVLRFHANQESDEVWPGYKTLMEECHISSATLTKAIKELVELGWITQRKRFSGNTTYILHYPPSSLKTKEMEGAPVLQNLKNSSLKTKEPFFKNQSLTRPIEQDQSNKTNDSAPEAQPTKIDPPVASKPSEPKPAKGTPDPRTQHPAIQAIRTLTKHYPHLSLYDRIIKALGDKPDMDKLAQCLAEWCKRGYNPNATTWAIEWYPGGIPVQNWPGQKGAQRGRTQRREQVGTATDEEKQRAIEAARQRIKEREARRAARQQGATA